MLAVGLQTLVKFSSVVSRTTIHSSISTAKDEKLYKLHHTIHPNELKFKAKAIVLSALKGKQVKVLLLSKSDITENEVVTKLNSCIEIIKNAAEEHEVDVTIKTQLQKKQLNITGVPIVKDEIVT